LFVQATIKSSTVIGLEMYEQTTEDLLGLAWGATTQLTSGYAAADIY